MAFTPRSTQAIVSAMETDKGTRAELAPLTNPSNVAIWYNLFVAVAAQINVFENLAVEQMDDIEERAMELPVGTLRWYQAETLRYQHGDSLIITDGIPVYAVIDETKYVVEVASASEESGAILIKAAKLDISNNPVPLSGAELSGLQQYWLDKRFAGSFLSVVSLDGDEMKAYLRIEVDGSIISSTGESIATPGTYPVEDAIRTYYRTLEFNGRFTVTSLIDTIQSVNGVTGSVVATDIQAKVNGGASYVNVLSTDDHAYNPIAGYIIEDTVTGLDSTLTYVIV